MKKIIPIIVIALLLGGYEGYSMATATATPKEKIAGQIYVLPKDFTLTWPAGVCDADRRARARTDQGFATTDPTNPPPTGFGDLPESLSSARSSPTPSRASRPPPCCRSAAARSSRRRS